MKILLAVLFSVFALTVVACDPVTPDEMDDYLVKNMQYVMDPKTGICFTRTYSDIGYIYGYVPCTDEVKAHLFNPQR